MAMDSKRSILWLDQITLDQHPQVGGKAATLGALRRAGLLVPDGFCITTKAYSDHLNTFDQQDLDTSRDYLSTELSAKILSSALSSTLEMEIVRAYQLLCERYGTDVEVAVRSSATTEDLPDASFAGQYLSILNVKDQTHLLEAIRQCWASASCPRAQVYQRQRNLNNPDTKMAVIVQVMVRADFAGVLFSVDPLMEDKTQMAIEMTHGLGDGVVSGTTIPLRFTLERETGKIRFATPSTIKPGTDSYEFKDWQSLLRLALQSEDLLKSPLDIEWAYANGKFWILQSRPITVQAKHTCRQIWTRANAGEILPGVISPLTWSIFKPTLLAAGAYRAWSPLTIHWKWEHPCGVWPDSPRLFQGRAYMELASVFVGFGNMPGVTPEILQKMLGFEFHLCRPTELPTKRPRWRLADPYRALRFWLEMLCITKTLPRKARYKLKQSASDYNKTIDTTAGADHSVVLDRIDRLLKEAAQTLGLHIQCTSMVFSAFGLLDCLIRRHVTSDHAQAFETSLMTYFQNISTVQQSIAIWDLAQVAKQIPSVWQTLVESESTERTIQAWQFDPAASRFLELWNSFIARFGDRGTQEFELAVPHWDADPSLVLQTMREILQYQLADPQKRLEQQQKVGQQATQSIVEMVRATASPVEVWILRQLIASYRKLVPLRENLKYCLVGRFNAIRKLFLGLGKILEKRGLIPTYDDIFFLRYEEILGLFRDPSPSDSEINALVALRKEEHQAYTELPAPNIWVSVGEQTLPMEIPTLRTATVLQGIACSPGQIAGPALVLSSSDQHVQIAPGQILVAPSIDPGLTPLFLSAAGLVTEIGGMLSHGATVAREYGLPAVVGVPHATRLIRSGQQILVDGLEGLVYLEPVEGE